MSDYIDRQSAIKAVYSIHPIDTELEGVLLDRLDVRYVLESLPSADVEPVRHGRWQEEIGMIMCSECGDAWAMGQEEEVRSFSYCPNCGARMDGEQDESR